MNILAACVAHIKRLGASVGPAHIPPAQSLDTYGPAMIAAAMQRQGGAALLVEREILAAQIESLNLQSRSKVASLVTDDLRMLTTGILRCKP